MWLAEGLELVRIYYQRGNVKTQTLHYEVKDPPTSGWQNALIMRGSKRTIIFCPYTLHSWNVTNSAGELKNRKDFEWSHDEFKKVQALLIKNWDLYQELGQHKDYDTAARVFKLMGVKAPDQKIKGGDLDTRKKGGKTVEGELKKSVKLSGKRGKFLEYFLNGGGTMPIRDVMAEFGMSRSNALSYLYMLQKDHGIGYELVGDSATVMLPEGCHNPFDVEWGEEPDEDLDIGLDDPEEDDDDSWLD